MADLRLTRDKGRKKRTVSNDRQSHVVLAFRSAV